MNCKKMKIYTKNGDQGETSLASGEKIKKSDALIEALGSLDELNAHLGVLQSVLENEDLAVEIEGIQNKIFFIGSYLAAKGSKADYKLDSQDVIFLEKRIDSLQAELEPLRNFILPGGSPEAAYCHLARSVCRRAERSIANISSAFEGFDKNILAYINRLSDYLFVLARFLNQIAGFHEHKWHPK